MSGLGEGGMNSCYAVTLAASIGIVLAEWHCRAQSGASRPSFSFYLARNSRDVLWPLAGVGLLFSAASLVLVYCVEGSTTSIAQIERLEKILDRANGWWKDHTPPATWVLAGLGFLAVLLLLRPLDDHGR